MSAEIKKVTVDGVEGWFFPEGCTTPPQSMCEHCGYLMEAERRIHNICMRVNRAGHGISGVTCGTDGYDKKKNKVLQTMTRKSFDYNRRKSHMVKYGPAFELLRKAEEYMRTAEGDKEAILKQIENMRKRYMEVMAK